MKLADVEMGLLQWARSPWTLFFGRVFLFFVLPALLGGLGAIVWWGGGDARARVAMVEATITRELPAIKSQVGDVGDTQTLRAKDSEAFQQEVRGAISDLKATQRATNSAISDMRSDVFQTKVDVAAIKLLLQKQANVAALLSVPPELDRPGAR